MVQPTKTYQKKYIVLLEHLTFNSTWTAVLSSLEMRVYSNFICVTYNLQSTKNMHVKFWMSVCLPVLSALSILQFDWKWKEQSSLLWNKFESPENFFWNKLTLNSSSDFFIPDIFPFKNKRERLCLDALTSTYPYLYHLFTRSDVINIDF